NWAFEDRNPSLAAGSRLTDKAVLGGVSAKPAFATLTPGQVAEQVRAAIASTAGRHVLIGPGCSVNPGSPAANYQAAIEAVLRN
ncbi:MAG TPA: uroporphyrinogen decarboxylase, partial [Chloroflexota bacterium]|nr:uroporphyrinogen decarboxylase [Chloroflexota bacterium]